MPTLFLYLFVTTFLASSVSQCLYKKAEKRSQFLDIWNKSAEEFHQFLPEYGTLKLG
jgi:hypothetical protein